MWWGLLQGKSGLHPKCLFMTIHVSHADFTYSFFAVIFTLYLRIGILTI